MSNHIFQITLSDGDDYEVNVTLQKNGKVKTFSVIDWQGEEKTNFTVRDKFVIEREVYNRQYYESVND